MATMSVGREAELIATRAESMKRLVQQSIDAASGAIGIAVQLSQELENLAESGYARDVGESSQERLRETALYVRNAIVDDLVADATPALQCALEAAGTIEKTLELELEPVTRGAHA